jgi:hypothetical protein
MDDKDKKKKDLKDALFEFKRVRTEKKSSSEKKEQSTTYSAVPTQSQTPTTKFVPKKNYSSINPSAIFKAVCLILSIVLILVIILVIIFTFLLAFKRDALIPTTPATTSTKISGSTILNIGQLCQYSNQCPVNAYCDFTCKCPDTYYVDLNTGLCVKAKTFNEDCIYNYECNKVQKLSCRLTKCNCETVSMVWDPSYSNGGGAVNGRCMKRKGVGLKCTALTEGIANVQCSSVFGSPSNVINIDTLSRKLNFFTGFSEVATHNSFCASSYECALAYSHCMDTGDGYKRCKPLPTVYWDQGWFAKGGFNDPCNNFKPCNEFKNLVCSQYSFNQDGLCKCINKYYYYNTTMCVYGKRYGESCTTSTECTPAGMVCAAPYVGATTNVCRCTFGTHYYDFWTETCTNLKTYNATCSASEECVDAYPVSPSVVSRGYCGIVPGGSIPKCLCYMDSVYDSTTNRCIAKTSSCTVGKTPSDCLYNQVCNAGLCECPSDKYIENSICYFKKYQADSCSSNAECWSTCSGSKCA